MSTTEPLIIHSNDFESVSEAVIKGVAETKNRDPTEVETLYRVIDPDSLDQIFENRGSNERNIGELSFELDGCVVRVRADGTVEVSRKAENASNRLL